MKIWTWIKSLSWMVILGAIGTAVLWVFNSVRASRLEDRAMHAERIAENIIQDRTKEHFNAAAKLQKGITKDKLNAQVRRAKAEAQLEKLSEKDPTMADIADRFNKRQQLHS